jgi:hypothetical protein
MDFDPVSLTLIEEKMLDHLQANALRDGTGELISEFDVRTSDALDTINNSPAVCIATESIAFRKIDEGTIRWTPLIIVYMVFKNVSNSRDRRHGAYPMLEGIIRLLSFQKLGLDIEPLIPGEADEIDHQALTNRGLIGFKVPFTTSFDVSKFIAQESAVRFLVSGIKYYAQRPDDKVEDAQDIVSLE